MSTSLNWVGDTTEYTWLGGTREKYTHRRGVVATVKFVPVANNEGYTGVL